MIDIRTSFDDKEASPYQQGDNLIIRLKDLDFEVGKAKIPRKSEDILSKISLLIASADTDKVIVEGHTNATGSKEINNWLSKKRAENVANYLKSKGVVTPVFTVGYASRFPLVKNNTKENRLLNRRVDILINLSAPSTIYTN